MNDSRLRELAFHGSRASSRANTGDEAIYKLRIWLMKFAIGPVSPSCFFSLAYSRNAEYGVAIQLRHEMYRHAPPVFGGAGPVG